VLYDRVRAVLRRGRAYHDLVRCRVDGSDTGCRFRCEGITSSTSRVASWGVEPSLAIQISLFLMLGVVL
jgi:hypothetical protein